MELKKMHWIGILSATAVLAFDFIIFRGEPRLFYFLIGIAFAVLALPFIIGITLENKKDDKLAEMFLEFTRNLAESVAIGTPISKAIVNVKKKNYGVLNTHIEKMANQIELGISVERAMNTFAQDVGSEVVRRAVGLISEAEKAGGQIDYILDSTARSISEVEKLKKERKAAIYSLVVEGYIIFFIFIGIILVMEYKIIPLTEGIAGLNLFSTTSVQDLSQGTATNSNFDPEALTKPFRYLLLVQGFFVGLVVGKLTEDSLKRGLKHSFIMVLTAFLVSSGARLILG